MQVQSLRVSSVSMDQYPDRVPIIVLISSRSKLHFTDHSRSKKYLVSKSDHFYHFIQVIRDQLQLDKQESLYFFVNHSGIIKGESQVDEIYQKYKSSDGFLRINLTEYPTFG